MEGNGKAVFVEGVTQLQAVFVVIPDADGLIF